MPNPFRLGLSVALASVTLCLGACASVASPPANAPTAQTATSGWNVTPTTNLAQDYVICDNAQCPQRSVKHFPTPPAARRAVVAQPEETILLSKPNESAAKPHAKSQSGKSTKKRTTPRKRAAKTPPAFGCAVPSK